MNKIELKACAVCVIAILCCGCASIGTDVKDSQLSAFQIGVTTRSDVIRALGPPESEAVSSSGDRSMVYAETHFHTKAATFIPIVGIFAGGAKGQSSSVVLRFDRNGRLAEVTNSRTNIDTGPFPGTATIRAAPTTVPVQTAPAAAVTAPSGACPSLGAELTKLTGMSVMDDVKGAMISAVSPTGAAAGAGIRQGDIVVRVGDAPINDPADVQDAVCRVPAGEAIDLKLSRQAQPIWVSVRF
jgi:membrane-associated protease RseP (regulator of RpoE activity)